MEETLEIIPRPRYANQIRPYIGKNLIKILTGQRRVGKSYILRELEDEIRSSYPQANFVVINLENFAFSHIQNSKQLYDEVNSRLVASQRNFIFIDEIQEVPDFDKVIRSLNLDPNNDIYITGSNSSMLSSEIASRLAGRSIEFRIHPLCYQEFLIFHNLKDSDESLNLYLQFGGMPYLRNLSLKSTWLEYLSQVTDSLVYRDIVSRHSVRNNDFLQRMLIFMADNIGRLFTAKKISDYLKSQKGNSSVNAVQNFADYFCDAYILNKVKRWNMEGKRFFEIGEKYYFEDLGIRNSIIGYRSTDIEWILENAVFNQLQADGYEVAIGALPQQKEIDFIARKEGETLYVQVSVNIHDTRTSERELGNLQQIPDNYEKLLITLHDSSPNSYEGIKILSIRDFLTGSHT